MTGKTPIPDAIRILVVQRYGVSPGIGVDIPCHYCGRPGRIYWPRRKDGTGGLGRVRSQHEFDHVVPEYLGGDSSAENIVLACRRCNRSKGTKDRPAQWAIDGRVMNVRGAPLDPQLKKH